MDIESCVADLKEKHPELSHKEIVRKCRSLAKPKTKSYVTSFFNRELVRFNLFGKEVVIGTPHRLELFLLFAYAVFFLWWDVLQNKVLDLGLDYKVTWFGNIKTSALDLSIIMLIIFHLILMALFVLSLDIHDKRRDTHYFWDVVIGTLAFFGVAIVLSGFLYSIHSDTIRFLFMDMKTISFYHIGVGLEMLAGLYWTLTL